MVYNEEIQQGNSDPPKKNSELQTPRLQYNMLHFKMPQLITVAATNYTDHSKQDSKAALLLPHFLSLDHKKYISASANQYPLPQASMEILQLASDPLFKASFKHLSQKKLLWVLSSFSAIPREPALISKGVRRSRQA